MLYGIDIWLIGQLIFAQSVDDVGCIASDVARIGGVGTAMYVAYRVVTKAYRDAHEVQRETVVDLEERRRAERAEHLQERAAWDAREESLLAQVNALQVALANATRPKDTRTRRDDV